MKRIALTTGVSLFVWLFVCVGMGSVPIHKRGAGIGVEKARASNVYILSVGINKYAGPINSLKYSIADAIALSDQLKSRNSASGFRLSQGGTGYLDQTVEKLKPHNVVSIVLKDSEATPERISQAFDSIAREIGVEDIFFFSYSGMGEKVNGEFVLLSGSADLTNRAEPKNILRTTELHALFRKIRARNKLIVLDSCDSSAGYDALSSAFIESNGELRAAVANNVLFIGTDGITTESPKLGHGVLTKVVLDGLEGEADYDGNGVTTTSELEAFVYCGSLKYRGQEHVLSPRTVRSGDDFNIGFSSKKIKELAKLRARETRPESGEPERAESFSSGSSTSKVNLRNGDDYALLFANSYESDAVWNELKNPINDVTDIAEELRSRYGFKEVVVKENQTTRQIRETLTEYQAKDFPKPDDQLFVFFAGHGVTEKVSTITSNSYYVGSSSPRFSIEDSGHFMPLDSILQMIAGFKINHVMTVFDACYAGQIWKPAVATYSRRAFVEGPRSDEYLSGMPFSPGRGIGKRADSIFGLELPIDERLVFAKRTMASQSRIVLTSGNRPVLDAFKMPDGTMSRNSPFAHKLLEALREGGRNFNVLTANEIYTAVLGLPVQPMVGQMGGTDGDFVFIEKK